MSDEPLNKDQIEPSNPLPINTMGFEPVDTLSEPLEPPRNADMPVSLNNDNPENTPVLTKKPDEVKLENLPTEDGKTEEINPVLSEPLQTSETRTAQIPVNEPLTSKPEPLESAPISAPQPQPVSAPVFIEPQQNKISLARELLTKARNAIQFRKRKKLDRVMALFLQQSKITNDEVEKYLHVSDATAERYLNILEKENKIKQVGKTGHAVSYSRI